MFAINSLNTKPIAIIIVSLILFYYYYYTTTQGKNQIMEYHSDKVELLKKDKHCGKITAVLNLCHDGSQFSIILLLLLIATVTKTSLGAPIGGDSSISIDSQDLSKLEVLKARNAPTPPPTVLVVSATTNNPLHVVLVDPSYVTADFTLSK